MSQIAYNCHASRRRGWHMRSEGFCTYSRGAYTNFLHEERKMRRLFFARRAYSTHFTRRVVKNKFFTSSLLPPAGFWLELKLNYFLLFYLPPWFWIKTKIKLLNMIKIDFLRCYLPPLPWFLIGDKIELLNMIKIDFLLPPPPWFWILSKIELLIIF